MRYAAFLRAINVGGHTVKMEPLRRVFESAGFDAVETIIASGNLVFESSRQREAALEKLIQTRLQKAFGYPVATFLRSMPELADIAGRTPFGATPPAGASLFVGFLRNRPADVVVSRVEALSTKVDGLRVQGREIHWLARKGFSG